ncbi:MAG: AAA family ATPase, partial [Chloroflexi bacterium]|nr:AAA family ATPase [Chloroflexota bacterium]
MNRPIIAPDKQVISPVLVGRSQETELLAAALALAAQGQGQCLLVSGEAGVGKSRLLAECCRRAAGLGFASLQGDCFEQDVTFPYAPFVDALRAYFARQPAPAVAAALGPLGPELVKLLPELALTLPAVQPTPLLDPEAEKRRLFEALAQFLARLVDAGQQMPLLLLLEDLHWADETSLDFLHFWIRRLSSLPVLVLATYRREEVSPPLARLLAHLERQRLAREIVLRPLSHAQVQAMFQAIFDWPRPVHEEFLDTVCQLTEGNPFFVEEVLKSLVMAGDLFYAGGRWSRKPAAELRIPRSVQVAVQRRTEMMDPPARRLLTLAAVAGRRFDFKLLQALTGQGEGELLGQVKALLGAQLVVEETADHFAFRHALTRQAVVAGLLARERAALHRTIAETMEQLYADSLDMVLADLAYHFYEAGAWPQALAYARQAGEKAQAMYA